MVRRTALVMLVLTTLVSCFLVPEEEELLAPPLAEPPRITYRTQEVERGTITELVRVFGYFVPARFDDLAFESRSGRLREVHVSVGDTVAAGRLIAELYAEDLDTEIRQAEIALQRTRLAVQIKESAAVRNLASAEMDRELARLRLEELERRLELEEEALGAVGEPNDAALTSLRQQVREQTIALRRAELAVEHLDHQGASPELELARLDVVSAELRLESLLEDRSASRLYASEPGRVVWVSSRALPGEYIQAFDRIVRIADPSDLLFEYQGRSARDFRVGMECAITIDDEPHVAEVVLTPATAPFDQREELEDTIRIRVADLPSSVESGDSARAELILARKEDVLVLPKRAVQQFASRRYVHVLVNGVQVERDVEVGLETATEVEIIRGLDEDEAVVLR